MKSRPILSPYVNKNLSVLKTGIMRLENGTKLQNVVRYQKIYYLVVCKCFPSGNHLNELKAFVYVGGRPTLRKNYS